jgi:hypothetical protein
MLSFDETGLATGRIRPINAGNVIETHKHAGDFKEPWALARETKSRHAVKHHGWLLRVIDRFSDYAGPFLARSNTLQPARLFLDLRGLLFETCGKRLNFR